MEVQNTLGFGFSEIIYKEALESEFKDTAIPYTREKELQVKYKEKMLAHKLFADYVCHNNIIIEVKSTDKGIIDEYIAQILNDLRASGCPVG